MVGIIGALLKRRDREQKGMVLLLTLILMALGMLLLVPLLSFMGTGLHTTYEVFDPKAGELYAADAGVREAMWRIRNQDTYPLPTEAFTTTADNETPLTENGDDISVLISTVPIATGNTTSSDNIDAYRIESVAEDPATHRQTSIEALVYSINLSSFADKIITSPTEVSMQSGGNVTGNGHEMWLPEGYTTGGAGNPVTVNDAPWNSTPIFGWPSASSLAEFYSDAKGSPPPPGLIDASGVITVSQDMSIGPFYYEGNIDIKKDKGKGVPARDLVVNLAGTLYIKGSLTVEKGIVLNLYEDPSTRLKASTPVGANTLEVSSTAGFTQTGRVAIGGAQPEEVSYVGIAETSISLANHTQKAHDSGDSVSCISPVAALAGDVGEGASMLSVNSTADFPASGSLLVRGANPEYLSYSAIEGISSNHIILAKPTAKVHYNGDPVEVFLRIPHTIFIEGTPGTWNFSTTADCTISGPGAIIAIGDIEFLPKIDADSGFIYVMSLGTVKFQPATASETPPSGFTGSVVAKTFLPLHRSDYTYPPEGYPLNLDIPMGDTPQIIGGIAFWKIY